MDPAVENLASAVGTPPRGWGYAECFFEGARERRLGILADKLRNLRQRRARATKPFGRNLHAPIGKIVHWRHAEEANEMIGQRQARQANLAAKLVDGPAPRDCRGVTSSPAKAKACGWSFLQQASDVPDGECSWRRSHRDREPLRNRHRSILLFRDPSSPSGRRRIRIRNRSEC